MPCVGRWNGTNNHGDEWKACKYDNRCCDCEGEKGWVNGGGGNYRGWLFTV